MSKTPRRRRKPRDMQETESFEKTTSSSSLSVSLSLSLCASGSLLTILSFSLALISLSLFLCFSSHDFFFFFFGAILWCNQSGRWSSLASSRQIWLYKPDMKILKILKPFFFVSPFLRKIWQFSFMRPKWQINHSYEHFSQIWW